MNGVVKNVNLFNFMNNVIIKKANAYRKACFCVGVLKTQTQTLRGNLKLSTSYAIAKFVCHCAVI